MVEEAQEDGSLDMQERELISSAIEFDDAEVEDIFVPRVNVIAVPIDMPMEKSRRFSWNIISRVCPCTKHNRQHRGYDP